MNAFEKALQKVRQRQMTHGDRSEGDRRVRDAIKAMGDLAYDSASLPFQMLTYSPEAEGAVFKIPFNKAFPRKASFDNIKELTSKLMGLKALSHNSPLLEHAMIAAKNRNGDPVYSFKLGDNMNTVSADWPSGGRKYKDLLDAHSHPKGTEAVFSDQDIGYFNRRYPKSQSSQEYVVINPESNYSWVSTTDNWLPGGRTSPNVSMDVLNSLSGKYDLDKLLYAGDLYDAAHRDIIDLQYDWPSDFESEVFKLLP